MTQVLASLLLAVTAFAQEPPQEVTIPEGAVREEGEYLILNFSEVEEGVTLRQFIKICQENTGLTFTTDESGQARGAAAGRLDTERILLYGTKKIRKADFYPFFQILMRIKGFVCVQQGSGDLAVIVITDASTPQSAQTIKSNTLFVDADQVDDFRDQPGVYITTVVQLKYVSGQALGTALRTALAAAGPGAGQESFMPLQTGGRDAILIQGWGPFVSWATRLVKILDIKPEGPEPVLEILPLQEASAEEVAQLLQDLLEETSAPEARAARARAQEGGTAFAMAIETKIIANPRDNSLLVTAAPESLERIKDLVAKLDTKLEIPETNFRVYYLQNIPAKDLADDLRDFLERTQQAEEQAARQAGQAGAAPALARERVVIVGQEETNALLITATRTKWAELERLLDRLDQRQPQVLIETALIEVSEDFTRDIGIEFASVQPPTGDFQKGFGFTSVGISTLIDQDGDGLADTRVPSTTATGLAAGILDGKDFGMPVLLAAAQDATNTNILSIPSVLVTNNRNATVESTDQIPTTTVTGVQGVGTQQSFANYQEAGIKLSISPSISARKYLRMDISLEISAFRGAFEAGALVPPPKVTRKLQTSVYLPDGATMWVGGIIRDDLLEDESGIPWLSDVPVLGWVFGRHTKNNVKTTLYFFCTPHILDEFEELADISAGSKARAAEIIGLERVKQVDPRFRPDLPLDVILDEDLDGDGAKETGVLDLSSFGAPAFVAPAGEVPAADVGASPMDLGEGGAAPPPQREGPPAPEAALTGRNLPEKGT